MAQKSVLSSPVVIDLTACLPEPQNNPVADDTAGFPKRKKKKFSDKDIFKAQEVLLVDDSFSYSSVPISPDDSYKQALGPLRMEFVEAFETNHSFQDQKESAVLKTQHIFQELLEYKLNLPVQPSSSIFVRAVESRLDLLRVAITGPEGTPYENGFFFFDVFLSNYPQEPPKVLFLTTDGGKVRFNPNLYNCGKVCLSLLGTWLGPSWEKNKSTLLQVLVSIQGLVLVPDPYFNEPCFSRRDPSQKKLSKAYNKSIRAHTMRLAICDPLLNSLSCTRRQKFPEFDAVVRSHFQRRATAVRNQVGTWSKEDPQLSATTREIERLLDSLESLNEKPSHLKQAHKDASDVVNLTDE